MAVLRKLLRAGKSGYWAVIFFQQVASIGNNITIQIVAGQAMKVGPAPQSSCAGLTWSHFCTT